MVGRDARLSGEMINKLVCGTLISKGIDVVDLDLSTTPTVEMVVVKEKAAGGIIPTASHNPKQWNALKLLNAEGEFISAEQGADIIERVKSSKFEHNDIDSIGSYIDTCCFALHTLYRVCDATFVEFFGSHVRYSSSFIAFFLRTVGYYEYFAKIVFRYKFNIKNSLIS